MIMPDAFPPAIYWSVLLAAVPAVIFWLCRKPAVTVMWAGMRFLEDAAEKIRFRARFLDAVQVTLQTAVIALCVAAVLMPRNDFFGGRNAFPETGVETERDGKISRVRDSESETAAAEKNRAKETPPDVIFVLDNSASMAAWLTAGENAALTSRLEAAKHCAAEKISRMPGRTRFLVMPTVFDDDFTQDSSEFPQNKTPAQRVLTGEEAFYAVRQTQPTDAAISPHAISAELRRWRETYETYAPAPAAQHAVESGVKHAARKSPEIYFFSDFQWEWTDAEQAVFQEVLKTWGAKITCVNMTAWQGNAPEDTTDIMNVGITEFRPRRLPVIFGEEIFLDVTLRNDSSRADARRTVELYEMHAGENAAEGTSETPDAWTPVSQLWADIPAEGSVTASFKIPVTRAGAYFFETRLKDDTDITGAAQRDIFPPDDARRVCFFAETQWRVLIVEAWRPETERDALTATAGTYLKSALAGIAAVRAETRRMPENVAPAKYLHTETLPDGRLAQTVLEDFHAVILCGISRFSDAETDALREYLKRGGGVIFFPDEAVDVENYAKMADFLPGVPVQFMQPETPAAVRAAGNVLPVNRFWKMRAEEHAQAVFSLESEDAFLLQRDAYRGRSAIFAISADMRDAPFPLSGMFLPVLDEVTRYATAARGNRMNLTAGKVGAPVYAGMFQKPVPRVINSDPAETDSLKNSAAERQRLTFSGIPHRVETPASFLAETENTAKNHAAAILLAVAACLLAGELFLRRVRNA